MLNLIRAEWLKLTQRPLTWVLLWIFLGMLVLQFLGQAAFAMMLGDSSSGGLLGAQVQEYARRSVLPGALGMGLAHLNSLGGIFAVILTAGAMGGEYSWGTLRTQLARRPNRTLFLLAKALTIMLLLLVAALITVAISGLLGGMIGILTGRGAPLGGELIRLPLGIVRALYVLLPYVLLTLCFTITGRSLLVGLAGGLVYLVFEAGFGALATIAELGGIWRTFYSLTIQQNINTLTIMNSRDFGLLPDEVLPFAIDSLPSPIQATIVVAVYSASFLGTAIWLLRRRDVGGAG